MNEESLDLRRQVHKDEHYEAYVRQMVEKRLQSVERRLAYLDEALKVQKRGE